MSNTDLFEDDSDSDVADVSDTVPHDNAVLHDDDAMPRDDDSMPLNNCDTGGDIKRKHKPREKKVLILTNGF